MTHNSAGGEEAIGYGAILRRWLWLILLLAAVTVAVVFYRGSSAPPVYQASVTLQVIAQEPEEVALFTPLRGTGTDEQIRAVRDEFAAIVQSTNIARQATAKLDLNVSAQDLLEDITVRQEDDFVTVMARAVGPQAAEALATTLVDSALAYYRQVRALPVEITEQFISEQLAGGREEMATAQDAFLKFKLQYNLDSLGRETGALQDTIRSLSQKRDETRVELERSLTLAAEMAREAADAARLAAEAEVEVQAAREDLKAAQEAAALEAAAPAEEEEEESAQGSEEASEQASESSADIDRLAEELEQALDRADHYRGVARTFDTAAINHSASAQAARTASAEYGQIIGDREAGLATLIGLSAEYNTLENDLLQALEQVNFLAGKASEAQTKKSQALSAGYLQIIEPAHTPGSPQPSSTWQLMALGAVVSLIVGTILAFLLEILTARLRKARQRVS